MRVYSPPDVWPQENSDITPDPQTHFGKLTNGLRFILKENQTPRDRVSMHLYVLCGSLYESQGEEGLAHFLEHLQFDGSALFPPGELVQFFQRIGMRFGPDANAHTAFDRTVYDIILPKGDSAGIAEGLQVLKEYAQGALLLPDQVEKEKKVVLAEKRSRDSASYRTLEASLQFQIPGTQLEQHLPIGKEESILHFDQKMVRSFYDTWYRPQNMILIVVGQFDPEQTQKMIAAQFEDIKPRADVRSLPAFGTFQHQGIKAFCHFEKEAGATSVHIETAELRAMPSDTSDNQRFDLVKHLADRIVQKRLDAMVQSQDGIMISARVDSGYYVHQIRFAEITADCQPTNWEKTLSSIEQTLRQVLLFGFTPAELERAKGAMRADLQRDFNEANTRDSKDLAEEIIAALNDWRVFQSPLQRMALLGPMLDAVTLEQVHQTFKDTWAASHRLVLVTGNAELAQNRQQGAEKILTAYQTSSQMPVQAPLNQAAMQFPYLPEPATSGAINETVLLPDLGIQQVTFANGLRLLMKKTAFKENEVLAALSFGGGRSSEPHNQPGLALVTQGTAEEAGFGAMDRTALENALSGRLASISLDVREDTFTLRGQAAKNELPLLFQLLQAAILDPGYRQESLQVALKKLEQDFGRLSHQVEGVMQLQGQKFLAGGDSRFGWPTWQQMASLGLAPIKEWFGSQLNQAPLELAVVGDFDPDTVIQLAARYLGTLSPRSQKPGFDQNRKVEFPKGQRQHLFTDSNIDKALVAVVYPTNDFWNVQRTRRLNILAELFTERLRVRVREKLGAAYSPFAYHRASRAYQGYGLFNVMILVDPKQVDSVVKEVKQIAAQMAAEGISADELRRALDPTLAQIKDLRQTNAYWLNSVLVGVGKHPEQLSWARSIESDYAAITLEEINALAKRYLENQAAAVVTVAPNASGKK
ncbi:MAG: insulinase family protein [Desulfobacteraceae bacterium]|nr:insulinase family protein [Desulfobacteraceae bacterium]